MCIRDRYYIVTCHSAQGKGMLHVVALDEGSGALGEVMAAPFNLKCQVLEKLFKRFCHQRFCHPTFMWLWFHEDPSNVSSLMVFSLLDVQCTAPGWKPSSLSVIGHKVLHACDKYPPKTLYVVVVVVVVVWTTAGMGGSGQ
eukprot:4962274-Amphidinium_carterae.1